MNQDFVDAIKAFANDLEKKSADSQKSVDSHLDAPKNEVLDIHKGVSIAAINIAAAIHKDWSDKEKEERSARKSLTNKMFLFLVIQWTAGLLLIVLNGFKIFNVSENIFISFFAAIIIQTIAIVLAMVTYLFKERKHTPLDILGNLISIAGLNNNQYKTTEHNRDESKKSGK